MGHGHDRPATAGKRGVEVLPAVIGHALQELLGGEAADEQEVSEHAPVILKSAPGDPRDPRIGPVHAEDGRIVVQRRATLPAAQPVPGGSTWAHDSVSQVWRESPHDARANAVASGEHRWAPALRFWHGRRDPSPPAYPHTWTPPLRASAPRRRTAPGAPSLN